jgi:hypothetical protein
MVNLADMTATALKAELVFTVLLAGSVARMAAQNLSPPDSLRATTGEGAIVDKARQAAADFTKTLPNFVCQEVMSRFESVTSRPMWLPVDVVTAALVYENGKESYRGVTIDGKSTNKGMEQLQGAWSTGEFGSVLMQLLAPATAANFRFRNDSVLGGRHAKTFSFVVARENSQWRVEAAGQVTQPAYGGSVWIDPETARVLRVEMQAHDLSLRFPASRVESSTDYAYVRIGAEKYLLPSHCETLTCDQGSSRCARNVIYFVDYHKYVSESNIQFGAGKQ